MNTPAWTGWILNFSSPLSKSPRRSALPLRSQGHDADGTVRLEQIEGTERCFSDSVIIATGQVPRGNLTGVEIGKTGLVITDEVGRTTNKAIFASGDVVTGAKTVVEAGAVQEKRPSHHGLCKSL